MTKKDAKKKRLLHTRIKNLKKKLSKAVEEEGTLAEEIDRVERVKTENNYGIIYKLSMISPKFGQRLMH